MWRCLPKADVSWPASARRLPTRRESANIQRRSRRMLGSDAARGRESTADVMPKSWRRSRTNRAPTPGGDGVGWTSSRSRLRPDRENLMDCAFRISLRLWFVAIAFSLPAFAADHAQIGDYGFDST